MTYLRKRRKRNEFPKWINHDFLSSELQRFSWRDLQVPLMISESIQVTPAPHPRPSRRQIRDQQPWQRPFGGAAREGWMLHATADFRDRACGAVRRACRSLTRTGNQSGSEK